jgi:hypothetical protein
MLVSFRSPYLHIGTGMLQTQINALWRHMRTRSAPYVLDGDRVLSRYEFIQHFTDLINVQLRMYDMSITVEDIPQCAHRDTYHITYVCSSL